MKKAAPILLILILAIIAFALKRCNNKASPPAKTETTDKTSNKNPGKNTINRNRGFDRRVTYINYTDHAKCRMQCRHITQQEVHDIMQEGKVNYNKSDVNDTPCPTYAVEGTTPDRQHVRIIFAQCDEKSKVVTVIDLDTKWQCDCPGDD